jgi:hypothetical protein
MARLKLPAAKTSIVLNELILLFILSGCGNGNEPISEPKLLQQPRENASQNESQSKEKAVPEIEPIKSKPIPSLCKGFEVPIFERPIRMEPRGLELTSISSLTLESPQLMTGASIENRCEEIERNFSGAVSMYNGGMIRRMSLFVFKFEPTYVQENQLKNGELVPISPKKVQIEFTDGGHYHRYQDVSLS